MNMKVSKITKLGILIVISVAILIWGLSYLKGNDIFKRSNSYHVVYDRIEGLTQSGDVELSGFKIGQVQKIRFMPDNSGRLVVTFMIDSSVKLPVNTVAQIVSSDLMGTRSIKLNLGKSDQFYNSYDTIPGAVERDLKEEVSMQVLPIKNKAENLLGTLDSALTVLTVIFNEDARKNLSESFENINQTIINVQNTTSHLQEIVSTKRESIENIISNIDNVTTAFNNHTDEFERTLKNLAAFSDTLSLISVSPVLENIMDITEKIEDLLARLEADDNTAGLLFTDDQLYLSLNQIADNLNLLMTDVRVNPERYVKFSAIDMGRKVYVDASRNTSSDIVFKVHLVSTEVRIPLDSEIFSELQPVEEYEISEAYTYLAGSSHSFPEILELHQKAVLKFPDASVVAFRNGKLIKLEKALRSLK